MFGEIISNTKKITPLTHTITNYVTVNDCANAILAVGGSPIMSDVIHEVSDITSICHCLVINMGNLNDASFESMIEAGKTANKVGHPVVLDPVAAGASKYRNVCTKRLIEEVKFSVIRGNISEIKAVSDGEGRTSGVDANADDMISKENLDSNIAMAKELSIRTGAVIAISGEIDITADAERAVIVENGDVMMTKITGSGCMLSTVIGAYCGGNHDKIFEATVTALCAFGLSGEMAYKKMIDEDAGNSSFRNYLIDFLFKMDYESLEKGARYEFR